MNMFGLQQARHTSTLPNSPVGRLQAARSVGWFAEFRLEPLNGRIAPIAAARWSGVNSLNPTFSGFSAGTSEEGAGDV
jgi:hypothetical protein